MKARFRSTQWFKFTGVSIAVLLSMQSPMVQADLGEIEFSNALESAAAIANQQTYARLLLAGCTDFQRVESESCSGDTFTLFSNVRELVHTANVLLGSDGPTQFSLDLDVENLGFALRWTAGEEFASQSGLTDEFVGGQLANLSARLKALRGGAQGFGVAFNSFGDSGSLATNSDYQRLSGGGASADQGESVGYSRWGGFINADLGSGAKSATVFEDAYDFEGTKISFGLDYRFDEHWVFGVIGAVIDQEIEFDSTQSVVDGGIETDGFSLMPYFLYQTDEFYASFSLGLQNQDIDMSRAIKYPSLNPNVGNVDTIAISRTDASVNSLFIEVGYSYQYEGFVVEPFVSVSSTNTTIDGFSEDDINNDGFDLDVGKQSIDSLETSIGIKLQYAWTPSWGVVVPFFDIQSHNQHEDDSRNISTAFANLPSGQLDAVNFNLPTDEIDSSYYSYSLGMSFIIQGDTQVDADGNASGSMQGFISYRSVENIANFEEDSVTLGFRYGF
ncbi:autotransporter outer membrane beta-barrel domain-containing protein [Aliikangiella marina]|uniref:Autotransporter outer membrane beta-barrel domain-containing protein n=1 Tax=Aliikangiella marina TaxID=1712262 RepID=A0A545T6B1_9GAMM|nr:autotransporter outer membrane beta-barrel domain-containing protein [Aliikangiella marina]TQV72753.1 autotransporter outer membrane beta-barrel domain-containing protein [Aliikangiella marina]